MSLYVVWAGMHSPHCYVRFNFYFGLGFRAIGINKSFSCWVSRGALMDPSKWMFPDVTSFCRLVSSVKQKSNVASARSGRSGCGRYRFWSRFRLHSSLARVLFFIMSPSLSSVTHPCFFGIDCLPRLFNWNRMALRWPSPLHSKYTLNKVVKPALFFLATQSFHSLFNSSGMSEFGRVMRFCSLRVMHHEFVLAAASCNLPGLKLLSSLFFNTEFNFVPMIVRASDPSGTEDIDDGATESVFFFGLGVVPCCFMTQVLYVPPLGSFLHVCPFAVSFLPIESSNDAEWEERRTH